MAVGLKQRKAGTCNHGAKANGHNTVYPADIPALSPRKEKKLMGHDTACGGSLFKHRKWMLGPFYICCDRCGRKLLG